MGCHITVPVYREPVSFCDPAHYTITGRRHRSVSTVNLRNNLFGELTQDLFENALKQRQLGVEARNMLKNFDVEALLVKFPNFEKDEMLHYREEFLSLDLDQDAFLNFQEVCDSLDEVGDDSELSTRRKCFQEIDVAELGVIDFEGYLCLISKLMKDSDRSMPESSKQLLGKIRRHLRQLTTVEKLNLGLL